MILSVMDDNERDILADQRANIYAPKPTGGAALSGFCGSTLALLAAVMISKFYGLSLEDYLAETIAFTIVAFGGGAVIHHRLRRVNRKARAAERARIDLERGPVIAEGIGGQRASGEGQGRYSGPSCHGRATERKA